MTSLQERIRERLDDPTAVSDEKRDIALADGNIWVAACPGSGKTYTVGLRLAWRSVAGNTAPIAATSYTNTAIDEMRTAAQRLGVTLGAEHFLGTLHSFLLSYVFYPFGHLVMKCDGSPRLVPDHNHRPKVRTVSMGKDSKGVDRVPLVIWHADFRANGTLEHRPPSGSKVKYDAGTWASLSRVKISEPSLGLRVSLR